MRDECVLISDAMRVVADNETLQGIATFYFSPKKVLEKRRKQLRERPSVRWLKVGGGGRKYSVAKAFFKTGKGKGKFNLDFILKRGTYGASQRSLLPHPAFMRCVYGLTVEK